MIGRFTLPLVGLWTLLTAAPMLADIASLSPVDNIRILSFFPDTTEGGGGLLSVYNQPGNVQRTLLEFDLSSLPVAGQIDSAILTLFVNSSYGGGNPSNLNMDVHAVSVPWNESEVTWNSASAGTPWATAGGDFDPFIYATSTANPAALEPVNWDITALVQDWYDGSLDNNGLLIKSFVGNSLVFDGTNVASVAARPVLTVDYSVVVPEASSTVLMGVGWALFVVTATFRRHRLHPKSR